MKPFCDVTIYFFLFGFCGWVCECIFCSIYEGKIINRGFLSGPICPVYGFGGLVVIYLLAPVRENFLLLFLTGVVATTALEYGTSVILEKLFDTKWWDYSDIKWNINGRVCFRFSMMFGVLSVAAERLLYPPFTALVALAPERAEPWIAWGCIMLFALDCANSVYTILSLNGKLEELRKVSLELRAKLEELQGGTQSLLERLESYRIDQSERASAFRQSIEEAVERWEKQRHAAAKRSGSRRLLDAFPHMESLRNREQLAEVKAALKALKNKKVKKSKKDGENS